MPKELKKGLGRGLSELFGDDIDENETEGTDYLVTGGAVCGDCTKE